MGIANGLFPCRACESKDKEIEYLRAELTQQNKRLTELARPGTIARIVASERPPTPARPQRRVVAETFPGDWDAEVPGAGIEVADEQGDAS